MRNRLLSKSVILAMIVLTSVLMTSCGFKHPSSQQAGDIPNGSGTTGNQFNDGTSTEDPTKDYKELTETSKLQTTEGFYPLSRIVEDYEFTNLNWSPYVGSSYQENISYQGEYSLTGGGNDTILVEFKYDTCEGYIQINNSNLNFNACYVEGVAIVDVDVSDNYKEVIVYDAGASDDPEVHIFGYAGDGIIDYGAFYGRYNYDQILFNQRGQIIEGTGYIDFLDEQIVCEFHRISNSDFTSGVTTVTLNVSTSLSKTFKMSKDITVAFSETDDTDVVNAYDYIDMSLESFVELKEGDEIVLINADSRMSVYYVELPDGRRGVFTDQLAG